MEDAWDRDFRDSWNKEKRRNGSFSKGRLRGNPEGKESAGSCARAAEMIKSEQVGKDGCGMPARKNETGAAGFL